MTKNLKQLKKTLFDAKIYNGSKTLCGSEIKSGKIKFKIIDKLYCQKLNATSLFMI